MSEHERDLAKAILDEIATDESIEQAQFWWQALTEDNIGGSDAVRWKVLLHAAAFAAIETVLARRQREAARTGPWQHGWEEDEDGYPGSLVPRGWNKRGAP